MDMDMDMDYPYPSESPRYLANFRMLSQLYTLVTQKQVVEDDVNQVKELAESFV